MQGHSENQIKAKILILGESKVGKSSLILRLTENTFIESIPPTLGIDYKIKQIPIEDYLVKLQIWDTAGQERFKAITVSYYAGAHGVVLVFDISDRLSFDRISDWMKSIDEKTREDEREKMIILLVGTSSIFNYLKFISLFFIA